MHGSSVDLHVAERAALSSEEPGEKQCDQHAGEYAGDKAEPEVMPKIHPEQFAVLGEGVQRGLREGNALRARDERIFADQKQNGFQIPLRRFCLELFFGNRVVTNPLQNTKLIT